MKGLQTAVILLVLCISTLEALKCYEGDGNDKEPEECENAKDAVCTTIKIHGVTSRGCMTRTGAEDLRDEGGADVTICDTKLCNN